jgi:nucleoside-diphosphate-sugar epimerase
MTQPPATRRAFLTGATGFIGARLLKHLQDEVWQVAALARPAAAASLLSNSAAAKVYVYDGETAGVVDAVADFHPDVVFHLASLFLSSHHSAQITPLIDSNIRLGAQILEAMKLAHVTHLVNAGTSWQNYSGDAYNPVNLYAATKQAFEDILRYYVLASGIHAITLRLPDSYGPGDKRRKLLRLLLECCETAEPLAMSPGDQVVDLVHVDDLCRAFLCAANLVSVQDGANVYAINGGQRRTLRQVVATFEAAAGKKLPVRFGVLPYREREVMLPWDGPPLPGWKPQIELLEGFRALIDSESGSVSPHGGCHAGSQGPKEHE